MKKALYVGSFDPFTLGHADIVRQALMVCDEVHIGIGDNPKKTPMFSLPQRIQMIDKTFEESSLWDARVSISHYSGSMMQEARNLKVCAIVRGLRQISDFGDEFTINGMVARSLPSVPMIYFICRQDFLHVSSSSVKEMASLGEDISWMVAPAVSDMIIKKIGLL